MNEPALQAPTGNNDKPVMTAILPPVPLGDPSAYQAEEKRMSRLWAWTFIVLAGGFGFIAGILVMMLTVVVNRSSESEFMKQFQFQSVLQSATPGKTWNITDGGTYIQNYMNDRGEKTRRFIAECDLTATEQANFSNNLEREARMQMQRHGGNIYGSGSSSSGGSRFVGGKNVNFIRYTMYQIYSVKGRSGTVQIIIIGEGEKVHVIMLMTES